MLLEVKDWSSEMVGQQENRRSIRQVEEKQYDERVVHIDRVARVVKVDVASDFVR